MMEPNIYKEPRQREAGAQQVIQSLYSEVAAAAQHLRDHKHLPTNERVRSVSEPDNSVPFQPSAQTFRSLVDCSPEITLLCDDSGGISYFNAALQRMLGTPTAQISRRPLSDFVHPDDRSDLHHTYETLRKHTRAVVSFHLRLQGRGGIWCNVTGKARNLQQASNRTVVFYGRDVTNDVKIEDDLSKSNERFEKIFRSCPLPMTISTVPEGRLLDVNDAFLQLLNFERSNVIGRTASELDFWVHPEERVQLIQKLRKSGPVKDISATLKTASGDSREVKVSAELVELDGQTCMLVISHDFTETRRLEERVRQSEKMEAIGRLAGGVAHDFSNVLSVIMGYSELTSALLPSDHPAMKNLREIQKASRQAADLTRQLLAFSRQQAQLPQLLDLNSVIHSLQHMLMHVIGEDISLSLKNGSSLGCIKADFGQIQQILMNLAINARDAMPDGGQLMIETSNVVLNEQSVQSGGQAISAGNYVVLSVSDTGSGMDRQTISKIFDPFFTTKVPGKGTGLGLWTVYGIVRQSNGQIFVYSEPGAGTTFKVYFPRVQGSAPSLSNAPSEPIALGGEGTVLVVEDHEPLRSATVELLLNAGYQVIEASSGEDAMRIAQEHQSPIDLVLTDVIMTGMNGIEFMRRIASHGFTPRALFMSGYARDLIARFGALEPDVNVLQKPFTRESLLRAVSAAICKS